MLKDRMKLIAALGLCLGTAALPAAVDLWDQYNHLKDDSALYVGEGQAKASEFGGDEAKARQAARERAREDLAQAVRVQIQSSTQESIQSKDGQVHEALSSQGQSQADVALENVKVRDFKDFPHAGEQTALAYVGKEDYRRQVAGKKVQVFRPEWGLKAKTVFGNTAFEAEDYEKGLCLGLELLFRDFILGVDGAHDHRDLLLASGLQTGVDYKFTDLELGYNWAPWAMRFQPFIPLRLGDQLITLNALADQPSVQGALLYAGAGAGLRYWPTDAFALEASLIYRKGLSTLSLEQPGLSINADISGLQASVGLLWSGF
jgi:hypothetical protein